VLPALSVRQVRVFRKMYIFSHTANVLLSKIIFILLEIEEIVIRPDVLHQFYLIEFVDSQDCYDILLFLHLYHRQYRKIVFNKWEIPHDSRGSFVDIQEYLKIWNKYHHEQTLFKRVVDLIQLI
jgi:hypothetical protein